MDFFVLIINRFIIYFIINQDMNLIGGEAIFLILIEFRINGSFYLNI